MHSGLSQVGNIFQRKWKIKIISVSERLNKSEAAQSQWPSMDDPENTESPSPSPNTTMETKVKQKEQQEEVGEEETPEVLVEI